MKITNKELNRLAERAAKSALLSSLHEGVGRSREELAIAYALLSRGIDPVQADMDMSYEKVIPLLLSAPYYDELDESSLPPEIQKQLDDVILEYGTLYDDDIVWDAKQVAKAKAAEHSIPMNEQTGGSGNLAWLFRFRAENGLTNEELLEDIAEIGETNGTVWKFIVRSLKEKYGYK